MIACTNCKVADGRPVFRTNPLGETPAGWMCKPCIDKLHDSSLIDEETLEITTIISEACPICNGEGGKPWIDTRLGREGTWRIACLTCRGSGKVKPDALAAAASIEGGGPAGEVVIDGSTYTLGDVQDYLMRRTANPYLEAAFDFLAGKYAAAPLLVDAVAAPAGWISVDERLPEYGDQVWVAVIEAHQWFFGQVTHGTWLSFGVNQSYHDKPVPPDQISHWMPYHKPKHPTA